MSSRSLWDNIFRQRSARGTIAAALASVPIFKNLSRAELGLVNAEKPDSQDICFVPSGRYTGIIDRLRELRGKGTRVTAAMIDKAINQTLSRTILTSGTALLATIILYVFGGQGIHAFAFTMLVGKVFGAAVG